MKNQRGVTLSRTISYHCYYGSNICTYFNDALNYSLETEKEVSINNDVQREARFNNGICYGKNERFRYCIGIHYGSSSKILKDEYNSRSTIIIIIR